MRQPLQVLFVEDNPLDAELVLRELRRAGFEPTGPRVDTEAEFLRHLHPGLDIILSDYAMPHFSGLRALELLRKAGLDVPFILISGTIGEETAVMAMKVGAADYLLKDRLARLGAAVHQALDQSRLWRERQKAERALLESEGRFRQLAENIHEVFWMTDLAKEVMLYVSPAYERIWGRTCESLYQTPASWLESIHADDRPRVLAAMPQQSRGDYTETYRVVRPDGEIRWIRDRAFPVRRADGELYRIAGVAEDVTERMRLEEQFRQAQKMEAIGQLAGGVAHDFNNLLAVIQMQVGMLELPGAGPADVAEACSEIGQAVSRASNLTRQLLMFSRRQVMHLASVEVCDVVKNIARMLRRIVGDEITLEVDCAPGSLPVYGDVGMLEQVVMNLVVNARDAMPRGGRVMIAVGEVVLDEAAVASRSDARAGSFVRLTVTDSGTGIPPEVLPHIFEPFFTTKEVGKGTGLGLATVYGIVRQHRGWIEVRTAVGRGTSFDLHLPRLVGPAVAVPEKPILKAGARGDETILLVEDEVPVRRVVRLVLAQAGFRVLEAATGPEAREVWQAHRDEIRLLLTDFALPGGMSGREVSDEFRREKPGLRVIFMSGFGADATTGESPEETGIDFLPKPFEVDQLTSAVRRNLDRAIPDPGPA